MTLKTLIRFRLTLHYVGVLALGLSVYGAAVFFILRAHAYDDLDRRLGEDIEAAVHRVERDDGGALRFKAGTPLTDPEERRGGHWVEVWDGKGTRLLTSGPIEGLPFGIPGSEGPKGDPPRTEWLEGQAFRALVRGVTLDGQPALIRAVMSERWVREQLRFLMLGLLVLVPLVIGVAALGGVIAARLDLLPLEALAGRAHEITADRLSERLPVVTAEDEVGRLALTLNETLARLEVSFDHLRRFTADASHELRTPLTALRSIGEVSLGSPRTAAQYRDVIGSMLEEVEGLTRLVESLLTLSRADAGHVVLHPERFDLASLGREVVAHLSVLAEDREQTLTLESGPPVEVEADRAVLRQGLVNLVDNAIKHSPEKTPISIRCFKDSRGAVLEVQDQGPGIPAELRDRVFDRFFRIDRSAPTPRRGAGLGLALTRWGVETSGGRIELDSTPGQGSTFRVILPPASSTAASA